GGRDDGGQPPRSERRKVQQAPEPGADECADDAHDDVANDAEAAPLHDLAGEEAGDETDQQDDNQTLSLEHVNSPLVPAVRSCRTSAGSRISPKVSRCQPTGARLRSRASRREHAAFNSPPYTKIDADR